MSTPDVIVVHAQLLRRAPTACSPPRRSADVKAYMAARLLDDAAAVPEHAVRQRGVRVPRPRAAAASRRSATALEARRGAGGGRPGADAGQGVRAAQLPRREQGGHAAAGAATCSPRSARASTSWQWMSPETKAQAHDKLSHITVKIGYPDVWQDYSALQHPPRRPDGQRPRDDASTAEPQRPPPGPAGRPHRVGDDAADGERVLQPTNNEIVFPAAILQPPYFDPERRRRGELRRDRGGDRPRGEPRLRRPGPQERRRRQPARLVDPGRPAAFQQRTDMLAAQYDAYSPLEGMHVNGHLTMGENIGDLSGLAVAYRAYHNSLGGREAPVIAGFTGDQRFFMGWAQVWRRSCATRRCASACSPTRTRRAMYRAQRPAGEQRGVLPRLRREGGRRDVPPARPARGDLVGTASPRITIGPGSPAEPGPSSLGAPSVSESTGSTGRPGPHPGSFLACPSPKTAWGRDLGRFAPAASAPRDAPRVARRPATETERRRDSSSSHAPDRRRGRAAPLVRAPLRARADTAASRRLRGLPLCWPRLQAPLERCSSTGGERSGRRWRSPAVRRRRPRPRDSCGPRPALARRPRLDVRTRGA